MNGTMNNGIFSSVFSILISVSSANSEELLYYPIFHRATALKVD